MDSNKMGRSQGSSSDTGTRDVTYDLTSVLYHALQGVENCQTYMGDAQGKQEHRQFFQMAMESQKKLAEQAKQLLHDCLMQETGGGQMASQRQGMDQQQGMGQSGQSMGSGQGSGDDSAFRFASSETEGGSDQFGQSGQSEDQRHSERSTSGGGSSSF